MIVEHPGNRLIVNGEEVREPDSGRESPAHFQEIIGVGTSPDERYLVSVDKIGQIKVWDMKRARLEKRIWSGNGYDGATAVGLNDDAKLIAIAAGLLLTEYEREDNRTLRKIGHILLPLDVKIVHLQFIDDHNVKCVDVNGKKLIVERPPILRIQQPK